MGLAINYSGQFNKNASLPLMIEEVKDIVKACKWEYGIFDDDFPANNISEDYTDEVFGIMFTPPECETVSLTFLSNRKMSSFVNLKLFGRDGEVPNEDYLYMLSTKTQFAGEEIHKFIIELFRYLKQQGYFEKLEIIDEGEYWETRDENHLHKMFQKYNRLFDNFSLALESVPRQEGESYEVFFRRIMELIRNTKSD